MVQTEEDEKKNSGTFSMVILQPIRPGILYGFNHEEGFRDLFGRDIVSTAVQTGRTAVCTHSGVSHDLSHRQIAFPCLPWPL